VNNIFHNSIRIIEGLSMYLWLYSPFVGSWPLFQILNLIHSRYDSSQGRYLHTRQHKHRINAHKYPWLEWDSNTWSQCSSGRRQFGSEGVLYSFKKKLSLKLWDAPSLCYWQGKQRSGYLSEMCPSCTSLLGDVLFPQSAPRSLPLRNGVMMKLFLPESDFLLVSTPLRLRLVFFLPFST
jgi:hypothetical protein